MRVALRVCGAISGLTLIAAASSPLADTDTGDRPGRGDADTSLTCTWSSFYPTWGTAARIDREELLHLSWISLGRALRAWPGMMGALAGGAGQTETIGFFSPWGDDTEIILDGRSIGTTTRSPWGLELISLAGLDRVEIHRGMISSLAAGGAPGGAMLIFPRHGPESEPRSQVEVVQGGGKLRFNRGDFGRSLGKRTRIQFSGEHGSSDDFAPLDGGKWDVLVGQLDFNWGDGIHSSTAVRTGQDKGGRPAGSGDARPYSHEEVKYEEAEFALTGGDQALGWRGGVFWSSREERPFTPGEGEGALRWMRRQGGELRVCARPVGPASLLGGVGGSRLDYGASRNRGWLMGEGEVELTPALTLAGGGRADFEEGGKARLSWALGSSWIRWGWRVEGEVGMLRRSAHSDTLLPRTIAAGEERWRGVELRLSRELGDGWRLMLLASVRDAKGTSALLGEGNGGPGIDSGVAYDRLRYGEGFVQIGHADELWGFDASYRRRSVEGTVEGGGKWNVPWEPVGELKGRAWGQRDLFGGDLNVRMDLLFRLLEGTEDPGPRGASSYSNVDMILTCRLLAARLFWQWENLLDSHGEDRPGVPLPPRHQSIGVSWVLWD